MGNFYMTATIGDAPHDSIIAELHNLKTFVGPTVGRYTVLYPELMQFSSPDSHIIWAHLSNELSTTILVSSVYDDDVLYYELWEKGALVDQYVSDPSAMGEEDQDSTPHGGNVAQLCAAFHCDDQAHLNEVLSAPRTAQRYIFETDRHKDLVQALALPGSSVGYGFSYIEQGEIPPGVTASQMIKLPRE